MTTQEIVKALKCCESLDEPCDSCPMKKERPDCLDKLLRYSSDEIKSLTAEKEQATQERDAWKHRAEAAVRDLHSIVRYAEDGCKLCAHNHPCAGKDCPQYMSGMGLTGPDGKEYPDWKWTCEDFEYGTCPVMENTPCSVCNCVSHWQWRGPCAENGGTDATD